MTLLTMHHCTPHTPHHTILNHTTPHHATPHTPHLSLHSLLPTLPGKYKADTLGCAANIYGKDATWKVVMGTNKGALFLFDKREAVSSVDKAHGSKDVLTLVEGNTQCTFLVSGGRDEHIRVWNSALQPISSFDLGTLRVDCVICSGGDGELYMKSGYLIFVFSLFISPLYDLILFHGNLIL
jgi:WD40 repeat protein